MDKGFYSQKNVDELLEARDRFMLAVPNRTKWVQDAIDKVYDTIQGPEGYRKVDGEVLYVHTGLRSWGELRRRCYLHLYYNAHVHADDFDGFTEELLGYKEELESGDTVVENEEAYRTYFVVTETPVRGRKVEYDNEAVQKHRNRYAGYMALLTNDIKDPVEALQVYRDKDVVEKSFDDLKNSLDMKRLRIHSSAAMDGRLFVQFVALILTSAIRRSMRDAKLLEKYTVRELLGEMETLTRIRYSGKYGSIFTEVTRPQRDIMKALDIVLPA
jgi:transposase